MKVGSRVRVLRCFNAGMVGRVGKVTVVYPAYEDCDADGERWMVGIAYGCQFDWSPYMRPDGSSTGSMALHEEDRGVQWEEVSPCAQ